MELLKELFVNFESWFVALPVAWAYVAILAISYGENVMPPVPGDVAILYAGYLAGIGRLEFWPVVGLATLGGALGFMTMYGIGYSMGGAILDPNRLRWIPKEGVRKVKAWLQRRGWWVVAANRFLSGARSVISLTVGAARMDAGRTAVLCTLSAFVWTLLIVYAGYAVGDNLDLVKRWMSAYGRVMVGLLVVTGGFFLLRWLHRRASVDIETPKP